MANKRHLNWSRRAQRDLQTIGDYIARDKPEAAVNCVEHICTVAEQACHFPLFGRVVPEFELEDIREIITGGYRVVYRLRRNGIVILTVFEGHRQFPHSVVK